MKGKVIHISTLDVGGAASAAIRLHKALLSLGIDSHFLTLGKSNRNIPNKHIYEPLVEPISLLRVLKKSIKVKLGLESPHDIYHQQQSMLGGEEKGMGFSFPNTLDDITQSPIYQEADLIHLHWVAGWLDYPSFFSKNHSLFGDKPIVWTLHDLNPFSGGLHYAWGTSISEVQMGQQIPHPSDSLQKTHNRNLQIKLQSLHQIERLKIVSPSHWLQKQSAESLLFSKYENYCIHNGLDVQVFKPYPSEWARGILGLENKKTLLFVADGIDNVYKGFHILFEALKLIEAKTDYQYLVLGRDEKNILTHFQKVKYLGFVQDELLMALAYSAADVFVLPSLTDNFPNTMIEAICCGTPVIAFPTGGIPEAIQHTKNGIICEKSDYQLLANELIKFYEGEYRFDREKIAQESAKKFNAIAQAKQYLDIYDSL
ncbi:glycosyltransferase [Thermoflexibacter ruber]|uniref:Glycosyltransferase involved in cell wall bisynthesis n=1 Tax=Thermoflexibacter ruber TaxID=1003 RepID=A0A1I2CK00_9BACT|nr:glycosyltransferase [Thermoflexibacter ruber]SFE68475.1 Glycosyltransferase involved in cell wall bisynthesis [Thermoflexibacter ruber]